MIGKILTFPCTSPQTDTASCSECVRVWGVRVTSVWSKWRQLGDSSTLTSKVFYHSARGRKEMRLK